MAVIPTEPEERHAYFVALGQAGGAATLRKFGRRHFVELGRRGFVVTIGRYGGDFVWRLLRDSYLRKYPDRDRPLRRTTDEAREKDRLRAEARRLYPEPKPCVVCDEPATQRDHVHGVLAGNGPDNVQWRCDRCHDDKTRAERQARWGTTASARQQAAR